MVKKRKLGEIGPSSQQGTAKVADRRSAGDGEEGSTADAFSVIGGDTHGFYGGSISADEATTGSPHDGGSYPHPQSQELAMLPSGREVSRELGRLPRDGQRDHSFFSSAVPSHPIPSPPRNRDVLIIVPPTRQIDARRLVSPEMFAQGLQEALFGPMIELEDEPCNMWTSSEASTPSFEYFNAGHDASAVAPPVRFAVVHIRSQYSLYLTWHRAGLARFAHGKDDPGTTLDIFDRNRGLIRSAIHRSLMSEQLKHSGTVCRRCSEPAEWTTSCCSLNLCSYCLPRDFLLSHLTGNPCEACGKGITLHALNSSRALIPGISTEDGWLCTRQLLVQVEDERSGRTRQKDIFLFQTYSLMEDIQGLRPAKKKTKLRHMTRNGSFRTVITIGQQELEFLW